MNSLTTIILTYNEEKHISRCIANISQISKTIYVVDSFSDDKTCEIAESLGAVVFRNPFINHATQFNWALENCPIKTEWTLRIDCDEYLTDELINEINLKLPEASSETGGFIIKLRVYFMNHWIKHGGVYPLELLRLWRTGVGRLEDREMDEHCILSRGKIEEFQHDMVNDNLNDLTWYITKHNGYSTREMHVLVAIQDETTSAQNVKPALSGQQFVQKRWVKERVYSRFPLFFRSTLYFFYRYFLSLGFLDGVPGLIYHFLQGFWYRFLVDAKLYEYRIKERCISLDRSKA